MSSAPAVAPRIDRLRSGLIRRARRPHPSPRRRSWPGRSRAIRCASKGRARAVTSGGYFELLDWLAARDKKVFADLKFYDIPKPFAVRWRTSKAAALPC